MQSILQSSKECFVTGRTDGLHKHHVFGASNRKISEENGFWVWLTPEYHNMSDKGVHFNRDFDLHLKRLCQEKFECTHSHEQFMELIGRNYL